MPSALFWLGLAGVAEGSLIMQRYAFRKSVVVFVFIALCFAANPSQRIVRLLNRQEIVTAKSRTTSKPKERSELATLTGLLRVMSTAQD